jgi:hypothetical protein
VREVREGEEEALGERGLPLSLEEQLAAFERDAAVHGGGSSSGEEGDGSAGEDGEGEEGEGSPVSHGEAAAASGAEEGDAGSREEGEEEEEDAMTADFLSCCSLDEEEAAAMAELMREAALATATAEADLAVAASGCCHTYAKVQPEAVAVAALLGSKAHA